jgi:uncharacterized protein (TIGR00661 family)
LVAPLDWGLGHATRCIPLINALLNAKCEVIIAASGPGLFLLQNEFPKLQSLELKGYNVSYSKSKVLLPFKLLLQIPRIKKIIRYENEWLDLVIDEHKINLIISDNRFGLYTKRIPCAFITHQLTIKAPIVFVERFLQKINYNYINKFSHCWVPDFEGEENIAGLLSHPSAMPNTPVSYIGPLSRFTKKNREEIFDCCILLSGPEPQRTLLEKKILDNAGKTNATIVLLRGKPIDEEKIDAPKNVTVFNHLAGEALQDIIRQSSVVISRSGYTTVMELLALQKKSILIATPGQTEQEYLAKRLMQQDWCYSVTQEAFDIVEALKEAEQFNYKLPSFAQSSLDSFIRDFLNQV